MNRKNQNVRDAEPAKLPLLVLQCPIRRRKKNAQLMRELQQRGEAFTITEVPSPIQLGGKPARKDPSLLRVIMGRLRR